MSLDSRFKVLLNSSGTVGDVSYGLKDFLRFVCTGKGETEFTRRLEDEVKKARLHEEWRLEYVTRNVWLEEMKEIARSEGKAEGKAEDRLRVLQALIQAGFSLEDKAMVALGVTEEEYAEAKKSLPATV